MRTTPTTGPAGERPLADLGIAAAGGDRAAFELVHQRLGGGGRRLVLERTGGRADVAEELAQRTWVGVWQSINAGKYDPARAAISTFVYAVASKVWLQHLRGSARATGSVEALEAVFGSGGDPAEVTHAA